MRVFAFVPVERSLRPRVWLFAPLRDKAHSYGTSVHLGSAGYRHLKHNRAGSMAREPFTCVPRTETGPAA
jgi:hypothetical protein